VDNQRRVNNIKDIAELYINCFIGGKCNCWNVWYKL